MTLGLDIFATRYEGAITTPYPFAVSDKNPRVGRCCLTRLVGFHLRAVPIALSILANDHERANSVFEVFPGAIGRLPSVAMRYLTLPLPPKNITMPTTQLIANILIGVIGALHVWILVLEMFLWTSPRALKAFGTTSELAEKTKAMAANQGLYNGFLAAGLFTALLISPHETAFAFKIFFLSCVAIAGIYGGLTVKRSIMLIQTVPAVIALVLLHL